MQDEPAQIWIFYLAIVSPFHERNSIWVYKKICLPVVQMLQMMVCIPSGWGDDDQAVWTLLVTWWTNAKRTIQRPWPSEMRISRDQITCQHRVCEVGNKVLTSSMIIIVWLCCFYECIIVWSRCSIWRHSPRLLPSVGVWISGATCFWVQCLHKFHMFCTTGRGIGVSQETSTWSVYFVIAW